MFSKRINVAEKRKAETAELKNRVSSIKDRKTVESVATLYEEQLISTEVFLAYLSKNLSGAEALQCIGNCNSVPKKKIPSGSMPLVSVVIPTYGGYLPIEQTIDSVLCQDYPNIEIIVMDDAGNFVTRELMLRKYKGNPQVRYYQSKEYILSASPKKRAGFFLSGGEYIIFLDHDDYYLDTTFFSRAVQFLESRDKKGRKRREYFSVYAANALKYYECNDSYQLHQLNVSGKYSGEEYLYGLQLTYDKPLSGFPAVFVKEKLIKSNCIKKCRLSDASVYMMACLSGDVFISGHIIGAYRVGHNSGTTQLTIDRMIRILEGKRQIMLEAKKRYPDCNWDDWMLKQAESSLIFAYSNEKGLTAQELLRMELWGLRYCKKNFKACGIYFLAKYIESNSSSPFSSADKIEKQRDRLQKYYNLLNQWLINRNEGFFIADYLISQGWEKISIYGYGEIGQRLYEELSQSEKISIEAVIDSTFTEKEKHAGPKCYSLQDVLPRTDITIITPIFALGPITEELNKKGIFNIISVEDILNQV